MKNKIPGFLALGLLAGSTAANAEPVTITGYDVTNALLSGYGNWAHAYSGSITTIGSGPTACGATSTRGNYVGGVGTLSDGVATSTTQSSQLFCSATNPVITLYFDKAYSLSSLSIIGHVAGNGIAGSITGLDITFGGITQKVLTEAVGTYNQDEFVDLSGADFAGVTATSLTLSAITSSFYLGSSTIYNINEIQLDGSPVATVPEPGTLLQQLHTAVAGVGPGTSLADKVALAQTYFAVPDVQATCAVLTAFINSVRAQHGKKLSLELADGLTADAQAIMTAIGCD